MSILRTRLARSARGRLREEQELAQGAMAKAEAVGDGAAVWKQRLLKQSLHNQMIELNNTLARRTLAAATAQETAQARDATEAQRRAERRAE